MSRSWPFAHWTRNTALAAALLFFASTAAEALTFRLCECSTSTPTLEPGSTLTLGIRIEGDPDEGLYGLGASAYGYDESVIDFQSGQAVTSIFHGVTIPAIGAFDGLANQVGGLPLVESAIGANGNRVQIFNGVGLQPRGYNALDPGLDGVLGGDDAQIRMTFRMTAPGFTVLRIGTGYGGDGAVYAGAQLRPTVEIVLNTTAGSSSICPVPEPGVALLIGVGLAGLAGRKRRDAGRG